VALTVFAVGGLFVSNPETPATRSPAPHDACAPGKYVALG
jgi:hypothetical protein